MLLFFEHSMEKMLRQVSANGSLTTSLPQDIISMMYTFCSVLKDCFIHDTIDSKLINLDDEPIENMHQWFIDGISFVLKAIRETHQQTRSILITSSIEDCCAASNDYYRLSELLEPFYDETLINEFPFINDSARGIYLKQELEDLVSIMIQDAVTAAEYCQNFVMTIITQQTTLKTDFFSLRWEDEWTSNQPAHELIQILDEHFNVTEQYMCTTPYLFNKSIVATVKAIVCYYIRCLVCKADALDHQQRINERRLGMFIGNNNNNNEVPFQHNQRALLRMRGDISIISNFFTDRINQGGYLNQADKNSTIVLSRIVTNELWILKVIYECLQSTWAQNDKNPSSDDVDTSSLEGFAVVLHKKTGANALVTRFLMSDLWLLSDCQMSKRDEIRRIVNELQDDLQLVTTNMTDQNHPASPTKDAGRNCLSPLRRRTSVRTANAGLSLATTIRVEDMLRNIYEDRVSQGILPLCWLWLPKDINDANNGGIDDEEDDSSNDIDKVIAAKIQKFTRDVVHFPKHVIGLTQNKNNMSRGRNTGSYEEHQHHDRSNDIDKVITANIQKFTRDVVHFPQHVVEMTQKNMNKKKNHTKR
jgi:hypothetical protein